MTNSVDFSLALSDIIIGLIEGGSISAENIVTLKSLVEEAEEIQNKLDAVTFYLVKCVMDYAYYKLTVDKLPFSDIAPACKALLETISSSVKPVNTKFYLKYLEAENIDLCGYKELPDKIGLMEGCLENSEDVLLQHRISCMAKLLNLYLVNPVEQFQKISQVSKELKGLVERQKLEESY